jgi:hypothetical protein
VAPVAESFVRMRPDFDTFGTEVTTGIRREAPAVERASRTLGDAIKDGFRDGVLSGLPRTMDDAQDKMRAQRPGFTREGYRLGDAASDGFGRGFETHARGMTRRFGTLGRGMGGALVAGVGTVAATLGTGLLFKGFIEEGREAGKVSRITANAIKVTGGAANVTTRDVEALAQAISNKTAIDDEQIQASANMLLTFKNVANQAGQNNRIFDRSTQAAADLSVQFGSTDSAAKMLGKALNDPVAGISALSRAGVTFTEQQKEQIKTLVENGDALKAQGIILTEVESQVGGAAAAAADPMQRLSVVMANVKETAGVALLPVLNDLSGWLADEGPDAGAAFADWLRQDAIPAVRDFAGWVKNDLWPALSDLGGDIWAGASEGVDNFFDAINRDRPSGRNSISGIGDLITEKIIPALGVMAREGLPAVGTAVGELTVAIAVLGETLIEAAIAGLEAWEAMEDGVVDAVNVIFEGLDMVSGFVKGPFGNRVRGSIDDWKDWRRANQHELDDTLDHLRGLQGKLASITTDKPKQEFRSLSQVANEELDKIKDEDVNIRFQMFAQRFGGKPLPGMDGGAGHGHAAAMMARHRWSDPYGGVGGAGIGLNVRQRITGRQTAAADFRRAREAAEAATAGIGGKGVVNPYRITATWGSYPGHTGIDLAGPTGSPVHAIGGGRVARAVSLTDSYGKHVIVDHPGGWSTLYAHMSALGVGGGDMVGGGSVVGLRGSTGNSSGPHVHFEVRRGGTPIDPQSVLSFDGGRGTLSPGWNLAYNGTGGPETLNRNGPGSTTNTKVDAIINVRVDGEVQHIDLGALTRTARKAARETMTFSERLVAAIQRQADKAAAASEKALDRARTKWDGLAEAARAAADTAAGALSDLRSQAQSAFAGAQNAVLGVIDPAAMATDPVGHLATWRNDAARFVTALNAMAGKGLPPSLIAQVAALGPTAGYDVATAFAGLNTTQAGAATADFNAIAGYAAQAGTIVMNAVVPPEVLAVQQQQADALAAAAEAVTREGERTVAAMERQQTREQTRFDRAIDAMTQEKVAVLDRRGGEVIFRIVEDERRKQERRR